MTTTKTTTAIRTSGMLLLGLALPFAGACGGETDGGDGGDAFLSIVGDREMFLDSGAGVELQVRYHDSGDMPLAGAVEFAIEGDGKGAEIASATAMTDSEGIARVALEAGTQEDASFSVNASAAEAGSVSWTVNVEAGPIDPNGVYRVDSTYDVVSNLEGRPGEVVNTIIDITDETGDPAKWIVEQAAAQTSWFGPEDVPTAVYPIVNSVLEENAPELVGDLIELGENFGDMAHNVGVVSELSISGEAEAREADHVLTGVAFAYDGERRAFAMADIGAADVPVSGVGISMGGTRDTVSIAEHITPVPYGSILAFALDEILIPEVDPESADLGEFFTRRIDCAAIATALIDNTDLPEWSHGAVTGACNEGLELGAESALNQIRGLDDAGVALRVAGSAKLMDADGDQFADELQQGWWEGVMTYVTSEASYEAELVRSDNTFTAERVAD